MKVVIQIMLVFGLVLGQIPVSVFAQTTITQNVLAMGSYTIEQDVLKPDSDESSSAGKFLQAESGLEVSETGMSLTLTYTAGSLMSNLNVRVNGEEVDFTQAVNGTGMSSILTLTFEIGSLSDEISMDMTIMGTMNHSVRILLKEDTLKFVSPSVPEVSKIPVGNYTIEQDVLKPDSDESSSAGKFLQTESLLNVTEEQMKLTLTYTAGSLMSNLKIRVNGEDVDFTQDVNGTGMSSTLTLTFEIGSLSDEVSMDMTIMGTMNHSVRILLKEDTLKLVSTEGGNGGTEGENGGTEGGNGGTEGENGGTEGGNGGTEGENGGTEGGNGGTEGGNSGTEGGNGGTEDDETPEVGAIYYTIEQHVFKPGTTEASMAGSYLQTESMIKELNGKKQLTLTFNSGDLIKNVVIRVNGKEISTVQRLNEKNGEKTLAITFEIGALNDEISMDMTIDLGVVQMPHTVDIVLKEETLKKVLDNSVIEDFENNNSGTTVEPTIKPTVPGGSTESTTETTQPESTTTGGQLISVNELIEGQKYLIKNDVISTVATPRQALNKNSYVEVKNGVYHVTFGFGLMDYMTNLRISVNGSQVAYDVLSSTATTMDLKFKMNSLSDKIMVTTYVPAISRDVTFEVKLLTNAIYTLSENQANQGLAVDSVLQMTTEETEEEIAQELEATDYIKRYSIKNEVISDSELGYEMARKYTNEESLLEEVDGVLYLSVTFSGTDMIQNIRFTVNGEAVEAELTQDDTENHYKTYRFMIGSIEDDIQASMYIIPSQRDISFGIHLLADTQMLLSETTSDDLTQLNLSDTEIEVLAENLQSEEVTQSNASIMITTIILIGALSAVVGASGYFVYKKKTK